MAVKQLAALLLAVGILGACGNVDTTQYKTEGNVKSISCDRSYNYLTLDNGVIYALPGTFGSPYCILSEGVSVVVYHDVHLNVDKIIVEGAEEVTE